jgi:predicted MFS family arabinose efflux permease
MQRDHLSSYGLYGQPAHAAGAAPDPGRPRRRLDDRYFHDFAVVVERAIAEQSEPISKFHDGQLLGPPVGAYAAAQIGYRAPFILSFLLVGFALVLCHIYIVEIRKRDAGPDQSSHFDQSVLWGWALSFIATIHLTFLPSILPHILERFDLVGESAVKSAGFIMMGYTATAIIGNYVISRLTAGKRLKKVIAILCLTSAFLQLLLFFPGEVISFTVIRMLQTGVVAVVIPLVMASFASELGGTGIGFLNSARFAGNGVGPLMATFVLAGSNLLTLYLLISVLTILFVLAFWMTSGKRGS